MRSTTPKPEMPASFIAPPKPLAFQTNARSPLGATLIAVAFVHVLVIVLLLSHFGWLGGSNRKDDPNSTAGQSGIVIPVTLETAQSAEEAQSPEPKAETKLKQEPEPVPEPDPESAPLFEAQPKPKPEPEPVSIQTPMEPRSTVEPNIAPAVEPTITPAQTRSRNEAIANSGKPAGPVQQSIEAPVLPLTPAHVDPNYLHRPNPVYPSHSKRLREEGTVVLRVNLDAQGIVLDITIEKSSRFHRLDQAALEAVKQWRFIPAKRGQVALPSTALVPIEFKQ